MFFIRNIFIRNLNVEYLKIQETLTTTFLLLILKMKNLFLHEYIILKRFMQESSFQEI